MGQSPVNIDTSAVTRLNGPPLLINYERSELGIENTGHVVEVPIPAGVTDTLRIGNDAYQLVQYHFHAPSEHQVNGRLADIEGHFVHQNSQGDTAVVGIFFRTGADPNPLLDKILNERTFLGKREEPEMRACAAMALGRIGTDKATESLRKSVNEKEVIVRNAVSKALRGGNQA